MKRVALTIATMLLFAGSAVPAYAQAFDWHLSRNLADLDVAMRKLADGCSENFGYAAVHGDPVATRAKMKAHLYLSSYPDVEVTRWIMMFNTLTHPDPNEDAAEKRASNALLAADADPSSAAKAKEAYVSIMLEVAQSRNAVCAAATSDPFLAETYINGAGDIQRYRAVAEANFDSGLKEVRAAK